MSSLWHRYAGMVAAEAARQKDAEIMGELGIVTDWKPVDDCDCEACLTHHFTGADMWSGAGVYEFEQSYIRGRTLLPYRIKDDTAFGATI